jgi:hypothetical protein
MAPLDNASLQADSLLCAVLLHSVTSVCPLLSLLFRSTQVVQCPCLCTQDILAHPALTSTTAPQNGAEPGKLRIVCLAPGLVGVALESLGFANQRLAEQQADHRLQVSKQ